MCRQWLGPLILPPPSRHTWCLFVHRPVNSLITLGEGLIPGSRHDGVVDVVRRGRRGAEVETGVSGVRDPAGLLENAGEVVGNAAEMDLVSRVGDADVRLGKPALDFGGKAMLHAADMAGVGNEGVENELERRIAQLFNERGGKRVAKHVRIVLRYRQQQINDLLRIGAVGHAPPGC